MGYFQKMFAIIRNMIFSPGVLACMLVGMLIIFSTMAQPHFHPMISSYGFGGIELELQVASQKAPDVSLASKTVESFEYRDLWCQLATRFFEQWSAGKPLTQKDTRKPFPRGRTRPSISLMPCLGVLKKMPEWMDYKKVIEPQLGKFIKIDSFVVKELEYSEIGERIRRQQEAAGRVKKVFEDSSRYYLEAQCQWERSTATIRFTFTDPDPKSHITFISGFWFIPDAKGAALLNVKSNGYVIGQKMMLLAGYAEREQVPPSRHPYGKIFTKPGWGNNVSLPVYVYVYREGDTKQVENRGKKQSNKRQFHGNWQVQWWFEETAESLSSSSKGKTVTIDGKRWVRYDPPKDRYVYKTNTPPPFEATSGKYRLSIGMPEGTVVSYDVRPPVPKGVDPFTMFSNVIAIDDSTSVVDIIVKVPESVCRQRYFAIKRAVANSKYRSSAGLRSRGDSSGSSVKQLQKVLHRLHRLGRLHGMNGSKCVAGLSCKDHFGAEADLNAVCPEEIAEIDLYAEFDWGSGSSYTDPYCTELTDLDITFLEGFTSLEVLRIPWAKLEGPGLVAVKNIKSLRELELSDNPIDDRALECLVGLKNLETLYLCATNIHGEGLRYLKKLPKLKRLYLNGCHLSPRGWAALGELTQLEHLGVNAFECDDAPPSEYLCHLSKLQNLKTIDLGKRVVTLKGRLDCRDGPFRHGLVALKDLVPWIGALPKLEKVLSLCGYKRSRVDLNALRHLRNAALLSDLGTKVNIATDRKVNEVMESKDAIFLPRETLRRFKQVKELRVHANYFCQNSKISGKAEIGDLPALESVTIHLNEATEELYVHDMPKLRSLNVQAGNISCQQQMRAADFMPFEFERLRLENLPNLCSIRFVAPQKLLLKNVGTAVTDVISPRQKLQKNPFRTERLCWVYGKLTPELTKQIATLDFLSGLVLVPSRESDPASLQSFQTLPNLIALAIKIPQSPRVWVENIAAMRHQLTRLQFISPNVGSSMANRLDFDAQDLLPLEKMTKLRALYLCEVKDSEGEPLAWINNLPDLQYFIMSNYNLKKFHIHVPNSEMDWQLCNGNIDTFVLSGWSEEYVPLGACRHYVLQDMPKVKAIGVYGKETESVTLQGDFPLFERVRRVPSGTKIIIDKSANVPKYQPDVKERD